MKRITKIEPASERPVKGKLKVAAYCRVSTGFDDQMVSLETQKIHYEKLISSNPEWEFAGLYYDEGISGTSKEKRPALLQMLADCEAGRINRVVTKSLSRFARNTADCLEMVRKLHDLGVTMYFEKENIDTGSMESELLLSIMSSLAESESVSISENSKWSIRHRFKNGSFKISSAPFGYDSVDGELVINEEEARWVRWIFEQTLNGVSSGMITRQLKEKEVSSRKKGNWTPTTIRGILTNEKYIGDCLFQKTYSDHRFKRHVNHGERDQFYIEDHHEAIISREDFEAAGALLEQRAKEKKIRKNDPCYQNRYPFSGKIICGECGAALKRHINSTGSQRYAVWVCKQHLEDISSCSMKFIRQTDLECAFTTMMNKLIFARKEVLEDLLEGIKSESRKENLNQIDEINQKMEKNAERRRTLTVIMAQGYIDPALFTQESNELEAEAESLEAEKNQLSKEVTGSIQQIEALSDLIRYAAHAVPGPDFDGSLVLRFLDHATLMTREEIIFHLKCGLSLRERIGE